MKNEMSRNNLDRHRSTSQVGQAKPSWTESLLGQAHIKENKPSWTIDDKLDRHTLRAKLDRHRSKVSSQLDRHQTSRTGTDQQISWTGTHRKQAKLDRHRSKEPVTDFAANQEGSID